MLAAVEVALGGGEVGFFDETFDAITGVQGLALFDVAKAGFRVIGLMRMRDGQSLLQKTFQRAAKLPGVESVLTVTNRDLLFRTLDDYRGVNKAHLPLDLLLEPFGRNTAAAIAVAALRWLR